MAGAVLVAAGLWIGAGEARAQACADPLGVPEGVYDFYVDQLGELPLLNPETCSKLTRGGVAACHKAVASMAGCQRSLYRNSFKAQKLACGATPDPAECSATYKGLLDDALFAIGAIADLMHDECDESFASDLYFACLAV